MRNCAEACSLVGRDPGGSHSGGRIPPHRRRGARRDRMAFMAKHRGSAFAVAGIFAALSMALAASASATTFAPQATLTASDEIGESLLGIAVALSHDGNTALVGGPD